MIRFHLSIGFGEGASQSDDSTLKELGLGSAELSRLSAAEVEQRIEEMWLEWRNNYIDSSWSRVDPRGSK
jgi:hypothetical protein